MTGGHAHSGPTAGSPSPATSLVSLGTLGRHLTTKSSLAVVQAHPLGQGRGRLHPAGLGTAHSPAHYQPRPPQARPVWPHGTVRTCPPVARAQAAGATPGEAHPQLAVPWGCGGELPSPGASRGRC